MPRSSYDKVDARMAGHPVTGLWIFRSEEPQLGFRRKDTMALLNSLDMSSPDNLTVSFGIFKEQETLRLLELPPGLLASITSAKPPRYVLVSTKGMIFELC